MGSDRSEQGRELDPPFCRRGTPSWGSCLKLNTAPKLHLGANVYTDSGNENEFLPAQALWLSSLL